MKYKTKTNKKNIIKKKERKRNLLEKKTTEKIRRQKKQRKKTKTFFFFLKTDIQVPVPLQKICQQPITNPAVTALVQNLTSFLSANNAP